MLPALNRTSDRPVLCAHCGLAVPPGLVREGAERQFCCEACRIVFTTLEEHGLERWYDLAERDPSAGPARATGRSFAEFDREEFRRRHVRDLGDGSAALDLRLDGVHCAACAWLVSRLPRLVPGVLEAELSLVSRRARIRFDPSRAAPSAIASALDRLGYPPRPFLDREGEEERRRANRAWWIRLGVAFACAGNAMLVAFALWGGTIHGMDPALRTLFRATGLLLASVAVLGPGRLFLSGAWASLRAGVPHTDLPIAVALLAGLLHGAANTIRGEGEVYFESLAAVVFLLLLGRWVLEGYQRRAIDATRALFETTQVPAHRIAPDGRLVDVPVAELRPGDRIRVLAGEVVPADGRLARGRALLDLSAFTGESLPREVDPGGDVPAAAVNAGAAFEAEVVRVGEQTRIGRLLRRVEDLAGRRAPIVETADRLARVFVVAVLLLAGAAAWAGRTEGFSAALERAVALLVVSCPCALGLATPLSVVAAIGRAARAGILVRGGEVLERLARPGTVFLDKTGTLTEGRMHLVERFGDTGALAAAAALERDLPHPIARSLLQAALAEGPVPPAPAEREVVPGGGVAGIVDGRPVVVGSPAFVAARAVWPSSLDRAARRVAERGWTPVAIAEGGRARAVLALGDPLRKEAAEVIAGLQRRGFRVAVLSGDDPEVTRQVACRVGLEPARARGALSPEDKVRAVEQAASEPGPVVVVGDGVNDAAAMARADVGVAVRGGAEASLAVSDVYLQGGGLRGLLEAVDGARDTLRTIRRTLAVSLLYNAAAAALAITGRVDPIVAAILMPLSSLTVVTVAWKSPAFRRRR